MANVIKIKLKVKKPRANEFVDGNIFSDEKMAEFISTTVLSKKHPAYTPTKIVFKPENNKMSTEILLPVLEYPLLPKGYSEEFKRIHSKNIAKQQKLKIFAINKFLAGRRSSANDLLRTQTMESEVDRIDGIPYKKEDFKFPQENEENVHLVKLAELLGMNNVRSENRLPKKLSKIVVPLTNTKITKRSLSQMSKQIGDRLKFISRNSSYKNELTDRIEKKLYRSSSVPKTRSSGFFKTNIQQAHMTMSSMYRTQDTRFSYCSKRTSINPEQNKLRIFLNYY